MRFGLGVVSICLWHEHWHSVEDPRRKKLDVWRQDDVSKSPSAPGTTLLFGEPCEYILLRDSGVHWADSRFRSVFPIAHANGTSKIGQYSVYARGFGVVSSLRHRSNDRMRGRRKAPLGIVHVVSSGSVHLCLLRELASE